MPVKRIFLGTDQPALPLAAQWLIDQNRKGQAADLRRCVVVLPSSRAGRRLLEILVDLAESQSLALVPPKITTVGQLPELLYQARKPFADDLTQQLAWVRALKAFDPDRLQSLIKVRPEDQDVGGWLELGRMLQRVHRELASDALDFQDVLHRGRELPAFAESQRWQTLAEIQQAYLDTLDRLGLWDRQTARLYAIQHNECRTERPIVLVAAVDLNRSMRQMLDQVAGHVTALVYAPQSWADRFDEHGCVVPQQWSDLQLEIPDEAILDALDPAGQSELVVRRIAELGGQFRAEQITVGLPDERIAPHLVRQLDECQLPNRYGPGVPLQRTSVVRLLSDLAAFARTGGYSELAQLVRHPDLEAWLLAADVPPGWVEQLDDYYNEHLPKEIDGQWLGGSGSYRSLRAAFEQITRLTGRLKGDPAPLDQWLRQVDQLVLDVYGGRNFNLEDDADRVAWHACRALQEVAQQLMRTPPELMPELRGADAVRLVLDQVASQRVPPRATEAAIELVGWLELPLDDAPVAIVTSMNEGLVPSSAGADLFLPDALRSALGLDDNIRRYARDAYAVATLLAPWREATFVIGRRDPNGDPMAPSRLLLAARPEVVARRSLRFFDDRPSCSPARPLAGRLVARREQSAFDVPRPQPLAEPIRRMSITSFKDYLACPYRFYLQHVLKLSSVDDEDYELDGARFGSLAHLVLQRFGQGDLRSSTDCEAIKAQLIDLLSQLARDQFGTRPTATVQVQIEQLRLRLEALARWQAGWAAEGWQIEHAELAFYGQAGGQPAGELVVDGQPMLLTGRIDRIDVHQETGQRMILDYKTSDAGEAPDKTHRSKGQWTDLQLPLYRHLVRQLGVEGSVGLGYIVLPKSLREIGLLRADWSQEQLAEADEVAREVVRKVRAQQFWPPVEPPPKYSEELAPICMDGVFGKKQAASTGGT